MISRIFRIALKSIRYYRKQVVYQFLIIMLLCAVITGSLMTGSSVRSSHKKTALENIGNTRVVVSSGLRYFDKGLTRKLSITAGLTTSGILELRGSSQALISQKSFNNINIYAVDEDFFIFNNLDSIKINPGEVIINRKLALALDIKKGDDIIIRFRNITDIPSDAPFAPSEDENASMVLRTGRIAGVTELGNFSLSISQVPSANVFINISDLEKFHNRKYKLNRLLVAGNDNQASNISSALRQALEPVDVGLRLRQLKTGGYELISDRIFFDDILVNDIKSKISQAEPVITYLANTIKKGSNVNPYSFISAVPAGIYGEFPGRNSVIINNWLADDIAASEGDTVTIKWFAPDSLNNLVERSDLFTINKVVKMEGIWGDSLLMPDFPGMARSESCSDWDAGIPVQTNLIRDRDEDYWDRYKGTPKAFISYDAGREIWGSNYGPATAMRFPSGITEEQISQKLSGSIDPSILGFIVTDIYTESIKAAENSVDFGTLFLSLGFFLILASLVLLSFAVSFYFDLKKNEVMVQYSLGFKPAAIRNMLLFETSSVALAACIAGSLFGYAVNIILITALNSVWTGAVQTNALAFTFDVPSVFTGFVVTLAVCIVFMLFKTRKYLGNLYKAGRKHHSFPNKKRNLLILSISAIITLTFFVMSIISPENTSLSFFSGSLLLITMIVFWRQFWLSAKKRNAGLTASYYSFYPSHAITPLLFIAAGIFAVFITAINRKDFGRSMNQSSSGTGGYLLWIETSLPVPDDLNSTAGRRNLGLDEESFTGLKFIQMKRSEGNDASCLNLNHITAPPLLGADPQLFIDDEAFSFAKTLQKGKNAWEIIENEDIPYIIYGIADQTVLDWGLKIGVGDTLILRAENGQPLKIVIAAGLQSSVFQGFVLISKENFTKYYPSVSGHSIFLAGGYHDKIDLYRDVLNERLSMFGANIVKTSERLEKFYEITNTYLAVFGVFGGLGMIIGIAGLGFVLLRNYNRRRREFALMLAAGFQPQRIRRMIFSEQMLILTAGTITGVVSAVVATLPSIRGSHEIPWIYLAVIVLAIFCTGLIAGMVSLRSIRETSLIAALRKD